MNETGGQTMVFDRRGLQPFHLHLDEMRPFLRHKDREVEPGKKAKVIRTALMARTGREIPAAEPPPAKHQQQKP